MACSMCSNQEFNGGINANFARDVTSKISRGQRYVGLVILSFFLLYFPSFCSETPQSRKYTVLSNSLKV